LDPAGPPAERERLGRQGGPRRLRSEQLVPARRYDRTPPV